MPLVLGSRDTGLREKMDDPDCDPEALRRTYRQFGRLNRLISRWGSIYARHIRPVMVARPDREYTLLDVGSGGGDLAIRLAGLASDEGFRLQVTGADPDPRAHAYARSRPHPATVRFRRTTAGELLEEGLTYDFVISNHLIHHLDRAELERILRESERLCRCKVLFCDIERSDIGWLLFNLFSRPLFRRSFITEDGLTSIRRSYTRSELQQAAGDAWRTDTIFPCRLLLHKRCNGSS